MALIRAGVDINVLNLQDLSPVHVAIKNFQIKALKFALDFNMHALKQGRDEFGLFDLNLRGAKLEQSPLSYALHVGNSPAVFLLCNYAQTVHSFDPNLTSFLY
jgi:hypothetical protein